MFVFILYLFLGRDRDASPRRYVIIVFSYYIHIFYFSKMLIIFDFFHIQYKVIVHVVLQGMSLFTHNSIILIASIHLCVLLSIICSGDDAPRDGPRDGPSKSLAEQLADKPKIEQKTRSLYISFHFIVFNFDLFLLLFFRFKSDPFGGAKPVEVKEKPIPKDEPAAPAATDADQG